LAVRMQEVLDPAITIQLGTNNDFMFDIRGKGSPLFYAPGHAGSFAGATPAGVANGGQIVGVQNNNQVAGAVVWYNRDAAHFALALLPAIIEGGPASNDEASYALTFYYDLESVGKGSRLGAILALNSLADLAPAVGGGSQSQIITIGGGASLKGLGGMEGLEVFGEFYIQSGDVGPTGKAKGTAFNLGGHYDLQGDSAPWVEVEFTLLSGDKAKAPADVDVDSFLSYENVNDFLIIESNVFGLNWQTNMMAIKFMGGMSFTAGGGDKNNVSLTGKFGFFKTSEDVAFAAPTGNTDKLGSELDVMLSYAYSKAVSLDAGVAFLFASDILEGSTANRDNSTSLFTIGVSGKF